MAEARRLTRSETDRMVAGVCGGLAAHLGLDPTLVRVGFVLLTIFGGSGIVLYLAMWLIVPRASRVDASPREVVRDGFDEGRELFEEGTQAARKTYERWRGPGTSPTDGPPSESQPQEPHDPGTA